MATRYQEIAADLRQEIESGYFSPRALLPPILDLASRHKVSPGTVRSAIALLEAEGLIRTTSGRGSEVLDRRRVTVPFSRYASVLAPGGALGPWQTACEAAGIRGDMVMIGVAQVEAPEDVAAVLGVEAGTLTVRRDRQATIDGHAVQLQSAWYALELVDGTPLTEPGRVEGGVYGALASAGHAPQSADELVTCRAATATEAEALGLREASPVLVVNRVTRDADGQALELLRVVANPGRSEFLYDGLPLHF